MTSKYDLCPRSISDACLFKLIETFRERKEYFVLERATGEREQWWNSETFLKELGYLLIGFLVDILRRLKPPSYLTIKYEVTPSGQLA